MKNSGVVLHSLLSSHYACFKPKTMAVGSSSFAALKMTIRMICKKQDIKQKIKLIGTPAKYDVIRRLQ